MTVHRIQYIDACKLSACGGHRVARERARSSALATQTGARPGPGAGGLKGRDPTLLPERHGPVRRAREPPPSFSREEGQASELCTDPPSHLTGDRTRWLNGARRCDTVPKGDD